MAESDEQNTQPSNNSRSPGREISNSQLFANDIVFSDNENILFEEDLQDKPSKSNDNLMSGNPATRYTPRQKLNEGGMKAIWEVDDHRTSRKVAMALIQKSRIASQDDIEAFIYEARLTANLQHPNIIPVYDIALDESGNPYFTMKALKGETLGEIIGKLRVGNEEYHQLYTRTRLLGIFLDVCNAIHYAHARGVIHLDLKPSNVIVGDFGNVQVLDWGLSMLAIDSCDYHTPTNASDRTHHVSLGNDQSLPDYFVERAKQRHEAGGTPGYMSPEQAQGSPAGIAFQTDVYMLGAMLYEILTLQCPIEGSTLEEVLRKTVRGDILPPEKRAPDLRIPPALAAIAMKAMKTNPKERYANVATLIRDIHQYQDGFATIAENPTFITHAALLVRRHKLVVGLIAVSTAIIGVVLANSFAAIKRSERRALDALAALQVKNDYIATTAKRVAPDYLDLMERAEKEFAFTAAQQALDTGLAFDPSLAVGWRAKGRILLCQQKFSEAWNILSGNNGHQVQSDPDALWLAEKYKDSGKLPDTGIPQLVRDFLDRGMVNDLPRLFHHLNQEPFDPSTRFPVIAESLKLLNPHVTKLNFHWSPATPKGWAIDLGNNPELDDITPFCGLDIVSLKANNIGTPDLRLLTESGMKELDLSSTPISHLSDLVQFYGLRVLNIAGTNIRNLANIVKYPKLTILDLGHIEGLAISPQLIWCSNLKMLTVAEAYRNDTTIRTLARRGVIIIYTDD